MEKKFNKNSCCVVNKIFTTLYSGCIRYPVAVIHNYFISANFCAYNINQFKNKDLDYNRDKLLNDVKLKLFKMFADYDIISDNLRLTIIDLQAQLDNNNDNKLSMKQIALIKADNKLDDKAVKAIKADIIRLGVKLTDCNKEFTSMIVKMGLPRSEKETSKESYPKNLTRNNFPKKEALKKIEIEDAELIESEERLNKYGKGGDK